MLINVDISGITVASLVNEPLKVVLFLPQNVTALLVRVCKWKWGLIECQATAGDFGTKHNRIFLVVLFSSVVVCVSRGGKVLYFSLVSDNCIWNKSYIRTAGMKSNETTSLHLPLTIQRCSLKNSLRFMLLFVLLANANFHRRLGWNPLLPPPPPPTYPQTVLHCIYRLKHWSCLICILKMANCTVSATWI